MKNPRLHAAALVAFVIIAFWAAPVAAKDKWINLTTKNFNIISNADEGGTRKLALKLEQFHYVFSKLFNLPVVRPIPTTVMVFKNDGSFKPYKPLYNGKPANLAGYFQSGQDENLIALDISAKYERPMSLIFHEYTHLLTSSTQRQWPVWLKEGLAELYSTFDVDVNKVTLGAPYRITSSCCARRHLSPFQVCSASVTIRPSTTSAIRRASSTRSLGLSVII